MQAPPQVRLSCQLLMQIAALAGRLFHTQILRQERPVRGSKRGEQGFHSLLFQLSAQICLPEFELGLTILESSCSRIKPECYTQTMATLATYPQLAVWGSATEEDANSSANPRSAEPGASSRDFPPVYSRDPETGDRDNGSSKPLPQEPQPLKVPTTPDIPSTEHPPAYSEAVRASDESNHGQEHQPVIPDLKKISSMTIKEILAQLGGVFPMDEAVIEGE